MYSHPSVLFCIVFSRSISSSFRRKRCCLKIYGLLTKREVWILAKFSFNVFMDRDEFDVHKHVKKELGQYPAILTEQAWSIKDLF